MVSDIDIAHRQYTQTRLLTSSHPQIVRMMHANCVTLIKQAGASDTAPTHRRNLLVHAQNILAELEGSLKVTDELSKGLFNLYDYCYCLIESNDTANHNLACAILTLLRDTFSFLIKRRC